MSGVVTRITDEATADTILHQAMGKLEKVMILGWTTDGWLYTDVNHTDAGDILYLMERAKMAMMQRAIDLDHEGQTR